MCHNTYAVRFTVWTRRGSLATQEKTFPSAEAREQFLASLEDRGDLHEVLALSDPQ